QPGTAHLVVWPAYTPGLAERRHWHRPCWDRRLRRHARGRPGRGGATPMEIRASTVLPAPREATTLRTPARPSPLGDVALPLAKDPVAPLLCLPPLPTPGGMMDSHLFRKASYRLPALADVAVVRFNTRGTASDHGRSEGEFGEGMAERHDVAAAIAWCVA